MRSLGNAGDSPLIRCVYGLADGLPIQVGKMGRRKGELK